MRRRGTVSGLTGRSPPRAKGPAKLRTTSETKPAAPLSERKRKAQLRLEREARLAVLTHAAGLLEARFTRIEGIIEAAPYEHRSALRRRLYETAERARLPFRPAGEASRRGRGGVLEWLEAVSPTGQSATDLQQAWLDLLTLYAAQPPGSSPSRVLDACKIIQNEWGRRNCADEKPPGYFVWPSTSAAMGHGSLGVIVSPSRGMLSALGYHVGSTSGLPTHARRFLLAQIFSMPLPLVHSWRYSREWAEPESPARLRKMAETIAALVRNAKRRGGGRLGQATAEWEADLRYLRDTFYIGRFAFAWPDAQ